MAPPDSAARDLSTADVGFAIFVLLVVALLLPVQLASMILFDATGLDTLVPDLVFMSLVPAATIAVVVGFPAGWRYSKRTALAIGSGVFVVCTLVAAYLAQFYGVCGGPGC